MFFVEKEEYNNWRISYREGDQVYKMCNANDIKTFGRGAIDDISIIEIIRYNYKCIFNIKNDADRVVKAFNSLLFLKKISG